MRLLSLKVRNYRIHQDAAVEFDPARTLIGGANETGKSTLVEAAHRVLFMNHRRGGQDREAMLSNFTSEPPEVELSFEQHGRTYTVKKRFHGPRGHVELGDDTHQRWNGAEAEARLATLLGYDEPVPANQADAQWGHLWIRQGQSGNDPTGEVTQERDTLLERLQSQGGAAVMQSNLDARVAERFLAANAGIFTQGGAAKAGSPLKQAEDALAEAERRLAERQALGKRLADAIRTHETASRQKAEALAAIPELEKHLTDTQSGLAEAEKLLGQQKSIAAQHDEARRKHGELAGADDKIRALALEIGAMTQALEPLRKRVGELAARRSEADASLATLRKAAQHAGGSLRMAGTRARFLERLVARFKLAAEQEALSKSQQRVDAARAALKEPTESLARLPKLGKADVETLRQGAIRKEKAATALEAIATGIEWIEGSGPAQLDGDPLEPGATRILTETGDLEVAGHHFRIRPGGGNRLDETRADLEAAKRELDQALQRLGVADVAEAARCLESRQALEARIKELQARLEGLNPEKLSGDLERVGREALELDAELGRLRSAIGDLVPPTDADTARAAWDEATRQLTAAEAGEASARARAEAQQQSLDEQRRLWEEARNQFADAEGSLKDARVRSTTLVETHGEADARRKRIADAVKSLEELAEKSDSLTARLKELRPDLLKADLERHQRSLRIQRENLSAAGIAIAGALATLQSDGTSDPHGAESEAAEALNRGRETHSAEARRAAAVRRLATLFTEEQQRLSDQFTEPLVERISDYLRCLFGPDARARMTLQAGAFQGLELLRAGGPFAFGELSGGTREQLAAAVRLATAELLAENHGGCLPVVFDDAFTHSDPDRILGLQRMLDLAATRGLQVLVLTCTPADYTTLGARTLTLEPTSRRPAAALAPERPSPPPDGVSGRDIDLLLQTLGSLGGKSGNQSLREALGWDEDRYNVARDFLVGRGDLVPGRGRGGSVGIRE